ncbi:hypothetical protein ACSAZK_11730 [Methanosarcina sp. Mfa9]|uniref:hypothetical protein n=1 Tax=Methanosarcina sp. Mfa9 TaxID=3439063 RepID=UPI003F85B94D
MSYKAPLPRYKDPLFYTGLISAVTFMLMVLSPIMVSRLDKGLEAAAILSTLFMFSLSLTIFLRRHRCPACGRLFTKKYLGIESREFLTESFDGLEENIGYIHSEGNRKNTTGSREYKASERVEIRKHAFQCKECQYRWIVEEEREF